MKVSKTQNTGTVQKHSATVTQPATPPEEIFQSSLAANYVCFAINYICNETFSGLSKWVQLLLYFPQKISPPQALYN